VADAPASVLAGLNDPLGSAFAADTTMYFAEQTEP